MSPSCVDVGLSFQVAARTLDPGDELTCDYGVCGHFVDFACRCGARDCRGRLPAGPGRTLPEDEIAALLEHATTLPQPLVPFAEPETVDRKLLEGFDRGPNLPRVHRP